MKTSTAKSTAASSLKTGGDIDAFCPKCDLDLAHVIIAMVGQKPVRVQCKTCRTEHAYRGKKADSRPKSGAAAKPKTPRAPRGAAAAAARSVVSWETALEGKDLAGAKRYKPQVVFELDDVVDHPTFRFGVVTKLLSDGKMEVAFESGAKTLVHMRE